MSNANQEKVLETIYMYYPKNISQYDSSFERSKEHLALLEKLHVAEKDDRWEKFLSFTRSNSNYSASNLSIYAFPTPCFKANIIVSQGQFKFEIVFYISIISSYYAFTSKLLFTEREWSDEWDIQKKRIAIELGKDQFLRHRAKFVPIINEFHEQIQSIMAPILEYQMLTFGYELLPVSLGLKSVPSVETFTRMAGTATVFDCIFSEFDK